MFFTTKALIHSSLLDPVWIRPKLLSRPVLKFSRLVALCPPKMHSAENVKYHKQYTYQSQSFESVHFVQNLQYIIPLFFLE